METIMKGVVSRNLPQANPDNVVAGTQARYGRYGEQYSLGLYNDMYALADEGGYFVATNPTISTGIAFGGAAITSFTDTTGAGLALMNMDKATSPAYKRIYLDYIKLIMATIPTGTLAAPFMQFAIRIDNVLSRYTSGGSVISQVNPNADVTQRASVAQLIFGALTLAALSSGGITVARGNVRGIAPVVGDQYVFNAGSVEKAVGAQSMALATAAQVLVNIPPIILGPQQVLSVHHWCGGQTAAPVYEFEMGWWER